MQLHIRKLTGWMNLAICLLLTLSIRVASQESLPKNTKLGTSELLMLAGGPAIAADSLQELAGVLSTTDKETKTGNRNEANIYSYSSLHPRAISFVKSYESENREHLEKLKPWAEARFKVIETVFNKYSIPTELKYLAVVESELKSTAKSPVGAVGPWQLMPETAKILGLKVNQKTDERKSLVKSTHAAAKYLKDLYRQLNDWLLVIAAYNSGPARVESAMREKKSRDFWVIQNKLPAESRNHVKKFIAVHFIMEGSGELIAYPAAKTSGKQNILLAKEMEGLKTLSLMGKYRSAIIASAIEMEKATFDRYNPGFDKSVIIEPFILRLPAEKMVLFNQLRDKILEDSVKEMLSYSDREPMSFPREMNLPSKGVKPPEPGTAK